MRLLPVVLAALLAALPATAGQRGAQQRTTVWGAPATHFQDRFDAEARRAGLDIRADSLMCETAPRLACQGDIRGVRLQVTGQAQPEAVQEIRIVVSRAAPPAVLAGVTRVVLAVTEPGAADAAQREAAQRLLGLGRPAEERVLLGGTEARFRDAFRDPALVFVPAGR